MRNKIMEKLKIKNNKNEFQIEYEDEYGSCSISLNDEKYNLISKITIPYGGVKLNDDDKKFYPPLKKENSPFFGTSIRMPNSTEAFIIFFFKDPFFIEFYGAYDEHHKLIPNDKLSDLLKDYVSANKEYFKKASNKEKLNVYDVIPTPYKRIFDQLSNLKDGEFPITDKMMAQYLCYKGHTVLLKENK
jgi:hypothetical protein